MTDEARREDPADRPEWIRTGSVFVRAAHLLAASAVAGAGLLGGTHPGVRGWWIAAGISGIVLLAAELRLHRELYRDLCGGATLLKLVLIAAIPAVPGAAPWLISAAFVVAVLGAHLPRRWRHLRVF